MLPYRLPPAGNAVTWRNSRGEGAARGLFAPWHPVPFASGTAALAGLLHALRADAGVRDEVVFAAYNCPALISATVHAQCRPVLVDLAPERPWMDLAALENVLSERTLAVIGVDFLGLYERHERLRELCVRAGCFLIEDSAQAFPVHSRERRWSGDAIVLSFGRGKPVSLLGGGMVLTRDRALADSVSAHAVEPDFARHRHALRVAAYQWMRHPLLYWVPASIPQLALGRTEYTPLAAVESMPRELESRLYDAVCAYSRRRGCEGIYEGFVSVDGLVDIPSQCGYRRGERLTRYPILAPDGSSRARLLKKLMPLGASALYGAPLPEVTGVARHLQQSAPFPAAQDFAARLLTLPTHDGVPVRQRQRVMRALRAQGAVLSEAAP